MNNSQGMDYYVDINCEASGPYTIGQLRAMWNSGAITSKTLYCREGWSQWLPLSAMISELEPSARVPPRMISPPMLLKTRRSKQKIGVVVVLVLAWVGAIVLIIIAKTPSSDKNKPLESEVTQSQSSPGEVVQRVNPNEPMASSKYGLNPISVRLQNQLIDALSKTDELDALIKRGCSLKEYASMFAPIEKVTVTLQDALPSNDPRIYIFLSTMERYQQLALKLSRNEPKDVLSDAATGASLPKVLLLQVLNGALSEDGERMFNDIKHQIESGQM